MLAMIASRGARRVFSVLLAASCAAGPPSSGIQAQGIIQGHPKQGSSITHTQMCECQTCDPAKCCEGSDDAPAPEKCGDSYDFSENACGLTVQSCQSHCHKQVWRVPSAARCEDKRPTSCCG
jgi:hypothetical protein